MATESKVEFVGGLGVPRKGMEGQEHLSRAHKQPNRVFDPKGLSPTLSGQEQQGRYNVLVSPRSDGSQAESSDTDIPTSETTETQPSLFATTSLTLTFSAVDFLARLSRLLENDKALMTQEALSFLRSHGFYHTKDPDIFYSKTLKVFALTKREKLCRKFLGFSPNSITEWKSCFLIQNTTAFPRTESASFLSDILEETVTEKYFLSEKTVQGLLKGQSKPQLIPLPPMGTQEGCTVQ